MVVINPDTGGDTEWVGDRDVEDKGVFEGGGESSNLEETGHTLAKRGIL